ncbi:GDSL-like Lipase/Acylhydrolase-domain-containing protein [Cunninghamella echinulata]|nr:GDSL-like Lipase/Acylhydrolase-domain-containing protein [Cunninghamella echinulata]
MVPFITTFAVGVSVSSITQCPSLTPRATPAKDITDLRPDDIKVMGGLGDSIMAGYVMMGVDGPIDIDSLLEYRGHSYAIGADENAVTVANFMNHYQPIKKGPSVGTHLATTCNRMNTFAGIDVKNDWKMITIQIGSNDQCSYCNTTHKDKVTPDSYGANIEAAIQTIQSKIPKTLVNLVGTFNVSQVFPLSQTKGLNYCLMDNNDTSTIKNNRMCSCSAPSNHETMDELSAQYNQKLKAIAEKYKPQPNGTFGVVYHPANVDIMSFPIEALSNYDCFHPSVVGHSYMAKIAWNMLFLPSDQQPSVYTFDPNQQIYCPTDDDRIQI